MSILNALLRPLFDALLYPFSGLPAIVGLTVVSLITAIGMLIIFKRTSDQDALYAVKRRIHACIFEIRLFNDDFRSIVRAQNEILRHNLTYLRLSLVPMIWVIVPLFLVVAQLHFHYGYRGLRPGERVLVEVDLEQSGNGAYLSSARPDLRLEAPAGLRVETPGVWIPSKRQVAWRLSAEQPGEYALGVTLDGQTQTKRVVVSDDVVRIAPERLTGTFVNQLIFPAEAGLPKDSPLAAISVSYPESDVDVFGLFETHWMIVYFVLCIVFAFALRNKMGVQI